MDIKHFKSGPIVKIEEANTSSTCKAKKKVTERDKGSPRVKEKRKRNWRQLSSNEEAKCQNLICCNDKSNS